MLKTDNGAMQLEPGDAMFWSTTKDGASAFRVVHDVRGQANGAQGLVHHGQLYVAA